MILGRFLDIPNPDFSDPPPYVPAADASSKLETRTSRRQLLAGIVGLGFGATLTWASGVAASPRSSDREPTAVHKPTAAEISALPDWARDMLEKPPEHLIYNAGVYEMNGARRWEDSRLVPCFERLLDVALETSSEHADAVGACAARALGRFGATEHLERRLGAILSQRRLTSTKEEALAAIEAVYHVRRVEQKRK